ncbi:dual specificity tyrosine-phosphorylation-regulated kinase 2-like isoform X2 [Senna tora]|uniref:Dual specificity tyrosine-phosphorylation-regulated kinase 2-like isoform X2 n=1 Tax=Senna tora TaxID=362788 RepID=A0A834U4D9_9FABA|nr:dual specificity tyrosine-phosphorylation-regulated kinase 2-like isoform X2 [Senna tora]
MRKNGFSEAESALKHDIVETGDLESFDYEKFFFPMVPPPPPVRVRSESRRSETPRGSECLSEDEFVSLGSSTSGVCSSVSNCVCWNWITYYVEFSSSFVLMFEEFINPYGVHSSSQNDSESSSDRLSQFGTARDYPEFDMQNEAYWYDEKDDENFMTPSFEVPDFFSCQSEDKFVMTSQTANWHENPLSISYVSEGFQIEGNDDCMDKACLFTRSFEGDENVTCLTDYCCEDKEGQLEGEFLEKEIHLNGTHSKVVAKFSASENTMSQTFDYFTNNDICKGSKGSYDLNVKDGRELSEECQESDGVADGENITDDELLKYTHEDNYEVFDLRIIHRKNRTGFEENKDLPIVLNTVIAGRYYVTEYLGSAAFSRVVQAHDLQTGIDVCLKIIKNDKDFFDQSLDEIKLLKLVNKHDPADRFHILRLYDYFYHQEHLFIVTELLRANLYEFQKFNQESGGEVYFTLSRLQMITCQCLEALQYLHSLGVIHCDLKPENILLKNYRRCEVKVIDLGSSCFQTDNLCLYVQSRSYRAPEVMLGLQYDEKIDIWSLGCILAELCSGDVLFPNDAVAMILARMIGMLGPIDLEMLVKGQETHKYFTKEYDIYYVNEETNQVEYIIPEKSSLEQHLHVSDTMFIDFVRYLLSINPQTRPTATQALQHPWLSKSKYKNVH